jgi:hypothetical protein
VAALRACSFIPGLDGVRFSAKQTSTYVLPFPLPTLTPKEVDSLWRVGTSDSLFPSILSLKEVCTDKERRGAAREAEDILFQLIFLGRNIIEIYWLHVCLEESRADLPLPLPLSLKFFFSLSVIKHPLLRCLYECFILLL